MSYNCGMPNHFSSEPEAAAKLPAINLATSPQVEMFDYTFWGNDEKELKSILSEVFKHHAYYVDAEIIKENHHRRQQTNGTHNPLRILDLGAHVGIATHYFARTFPAAEIVALEPHPISFAYLQENVSWNRLQQVELLQAAVAVSSRQPVSLYADQEAQWLSSTSIFSQAWNGHQTGMTELTVPAMTLKEILAERPADLVKMDIEGAEWDVLLHAQAELRLIDRLLLEYHPVAGSDQARVLEKLRDHLAQFGLKPLRPLPKSPKELRQLDILEFGR